MKNASFWEAWKGEDVTRIARIVHESFGRGRRERQPRMDTDGHGLGNIEPLSGFPTLRRNLHRNLCRILCRIRRELSGLEQEATEAKGRGKCCNEPRLAVATGAILRHFISRPLARGPRTSLCRDFPAQAPGG